MVVGYIVYTATGLNAHISKLAVAPDWRRRGVARALVREVVRCARCERRVSSLSLHVDVDNAPALGLYRGEGFESEALLEVGAAGRGRGRRARAAGGGRSRRREGHAGWSASADRAACDACHPALQDYYCRGRHAHKMRLELDA